MEKTTPCQSLDSTHACVGECTCTHVHTHSLNFSSFLYFHRYREVNTTHGEPRCPVQP